MINRSLESQLRSRLGRGKVVLILGPRQVGKTTLVRAMAEATGQPYLYLNADNANVPELLRERNAIALKQVLGDHKLVILDEAQHVSEIGLKIKLLVDTYPDIQLLVTGSSSLELSHGVNESLQQMVGTTSHSYNLSAPTSSNHWKFSSLLPTAKTSAAQNGIHRMTICSKRLKLAG